MVGGREIETTWTTMDNFSKVRSPNRAADKSIGKAEGDRDRTGNAGVPPAIETSEKPNVFHNLTPPSWEVRLPVAPLWMVSGRNAGEEDLQEHLKPRFATSNGLEGDGPGIENHENRFADMGKREGGGWPVGARASRPRRS